MIPTQNRLIVTWLPVHKVGTLHMPEMTKDYHNSDSVKMFRVVAAGLGRTTRKGVFIPNEIHPGDNVIVDSRVAERPEELGQNQYLIRNPDKCVIGVCPVEASSTPQPQPQSESAS